MGDLTLVEPCDFLVAELTFLVTLLLEYFGECIIRVTILFEYLDRAFSICLFYNSLIFNLIFPSFVKVSFLCLVQLYSIFQLIPRCSLYDISQNS